MRVLLTFLLLLPSLATAQTAVFTVNSVQALSPYDADAVPGDGICATNEFFGPAKCSFRAAIEEANATPGSGEVRIEFGLTGETSGIYVISPTNPLPSITRVNVTIDGSTQAGAHCGTLEWASPGVSTLDGHDIRIELNGGAMSVRSPGLEFTAPQASLRGIAIHSFDAPGAIFSGAAPVPTAQNRNNVSCSYFSFKADGVTRGTGQVIGLDIEGPTDVDRVVAASASNETGAIFVAGTDARITGSLVGLNAQYGASGGGTQRQGVGIFFRSASGIVEESWIGDSSGAFNTVYGDGVRAEDGSIVSISQTRIGYSRNATGYFAVPQRNGVQLDDNSAVFVDESWIAGNSDRGVLAQGGSQVTIQRSRIGAVEPVPAAVDPTLTLLSGNGKYGVLIYRGATGTIGSIADPTLGNLIVGHSEAGILAEEVPDVIEIGGNVIGAYTPEGGAETSVGNTVGIQLYGSKGTVVGNRISGQTQDGIEVGRRFQSALQTPGSVLRSNVIGLDASGLRAIPNGSTAVNISADNTRVENNVIAGNAGSGMLITSNDVVVTGNVIGKAGGGGVTQAEIGPLGNRLDGIRLQGERATITGNSIGYNGFSGIIVGSNVTAFDASKNTFTSNGNAPIDIRENGVSENDPGDQDLTSPSGTGVLNHPVLEDVTPGFGPMTVVNFDLDVQSGSYEVSIYATPTPDTMPSAHPDGYGEGRYIASGDFRFLGTGPFSNGLLVPTDSLKPGEYLTAMTMGTVDGLDGPMTSEMGPNARVLAGSSALSVQVSLLLQGAFDGVDNRTDLTAQDVLPLADPYELGAYVSPRNSTVFTDNNVVDWVIVEVYVGSSPETVQVVATKPGLLLQNGQVKSTDAINDLTFSALPAGPYYVGIRHRNHMPVMTAVPSTSSSPVIDFRNAGAAYGTNAQAEVAPGVFALWAGRGPDLDEVTARAITAEYLVPRPPGVPVYAVADFNLDGLVTVEDALLWSRVNGR